MNKSKPAEISKKDGTWALRATASSISLQTTIFSHNVWMGSQRAWDILGQLQEPVCRRDLTALSCSLSHRFIAVSIPLNYNRRQIDVRQLVLISTTWIFAFAVASPVIFGLNNVPDRDPTLCQLEDNNYIVYSSICSFFIPCPVMLVLYCAMFQGLRRWEEARKAKLKSSIYLGNRRLYCPPPLIERNQTEIKLEEHNLHACSELSFPKDYVNNGIQTVSYPHLRYLPHPGLKRKPAKITGRERKAMKVLPVVVGEYTVFSGQ